MKGTYWTENFVARASWGASPSKPDLTGYMDPSKMVGAMGHHTASNRCSTQSDCKTKMKNFQEDAFDRGMRYAQHMHFVQKNTKFSDMEYNFYIGDDGYIYEGRGINLIAAHW